MPKGYPNKRVVESGGAPVDSLAQGAQSTARPVEAVRSRDELEADRVASEFLKNNRSNLVGFEQRLPFVPERAGWVRRWVNDANSRVQSLMQRGWRLVQSGEVPATTESIGRGNTDIGGQVSVVSSMGDGPLRVVLMEVPKKLFDMQMDASLESVRRTEEAIRQGRNGLEDSQHVYTPRGYENRLETPQ